MLRQSIYFILGAIATVSKADEYIPTCKNGPRICGSEGTCGENQVCFTPPNGMAPDPRSYCADKVKPQRDQNCGKWKPDCPASGLVDDPRMECNCFPKEFVYEMYCEPAPKPKSLGFAQKRTSGGYGGERYPTDDEEEMFDDLIDQIEDKTGKTYGDIEVIKVRSQVVNGTNYIVKYETITGENRTRHHYEYILVKVYKPIDGDAQVVEVRENGITYDSPIDINM